jgi:hypothetical protein
VNRIDRDRCGSPSAHRILQFSGMLASMTIDQSAALVARLGRVSFAGVALFTIACVAAQALRTDLDWTHAPLSFYLVGPGGYAIKAAYFLLSTSIVTIGAGCYRALEPDARSGAPLLLFVLAAFALDATALCDTATHPGDLSLHAFLHNLAALTTFLTITVAMLLQAWRFRYDTIWRRRFAFALGLAIAAFAALAIYSLTHLRPRGLVQKSVIVLILFWLGSVARWLTQGRYTNAQGSR